eukprot:GFUD01121333.1.p1 GENE.GFUD01121333.1~~GFUD01121333.1.p1  ORF type:complete len:181 (-),score=60.18 GFUD01121333.1:566-1108(-)
MTMDSFLLEPSLDSVKALLILDNDGNRIMAKYYDDLTWAGVADQKKFEKSLFTKTHKANAEIIMLDGMNCLYKSNVDLFFYVIGSGQENELLLMSVLDCLYSTVSSILRKNVDKRALFDHIDVVMLAMDEMIDGGIILEADPAEVTARICLRSDDIPLGEQTVAQVLQSAKEQLKWSLLK